MVAFDIHFDIQGQLIRSNNHCRYEVYVPENVAPGGTIAWIRAHDKDSGIFGSAGIRYTGLTGPIRDHLDLDPISGIVSLAKSGTGVFDREKSDFHYLTVEARDDLGKQKLDN